jgi:hypothetical protein
MPAAASEVSICNLALGWVGGSLITSLDDPSTEANLCKANYALTRDAVLESADWSFATRRSEGGAPLAQAPAWGYANAFQLDANYLRMVYVGASPRPEEDDPVQHWVLEGRRILADADRIYLRGIQVIEDPGLFSGLFVQALAAWIARDLAIPISHSRSLQADMHQLLQVKLSEAIAQDSKQGKSKVIRAQGMNIARRAGSTGGTIGPTI